MPARFQSGSDISQRRLSCPDIRRRTINKDSRPYYSKGGFHAKSGPPDGAEVEIAPGFFRKAPRCYPSVRHKAAIGFKDCSEIQVKVITRLEVIAFIQDKPEKSLPDVAEPGQDERKG
jgi:hypothetical protein